MGDILNDMAKLGELSTDNVLERSHPFDHLNAFCEDKVKKSFDRESLLKNAPNRNEEMFITPKTVE